MSAWAPSARNRFLKAIGSSDDPMAADWMESAPQEMTTIHFSKRPTSVRVDDYLVYYATGWQKVIGIVQVFTKPELNAQLKRWPYWATVRPKLMIRDFERAPDVELLNIEGGRDFKKAVMQMDYKFLEDAEYARALELLLMVVDTEKGDHLDPLFAIANGIAEQSPKVLDWPDPGPGPGMAEMTGADPWTYPGHEPPLTPNESLRRSDIPGPNAGWGEIGWFALRLNGYKAIGDEEVVRLANQSVEYHQVHGTIDPNLDLTQLRGCLFFEQRRFRHFGHDPDASAVPYIRALVEAIRAATEH